MKAKLLSLNVSWEMEINIWTIHTWHFSITVSLNIHLAVTSWLPAWEDGHLSPIWKVGNPLIINTKGGLYLSISIGVQDIHFHTNPMWMPSIDVDHVSGGIQNAIQSVQSCLETFVPVKQNCTYHRHGICVIPHRSLARLHTGNTQRLSPDMYNNTPGRIHCSEYHGNGWAISNREQLWRDWQMLRMQAGACIHPWWCISSNFSNKWARSSYSS